MKRILLVSTLLFSPLVFANDPVSSGSDAKRKQGMNTPVRALNKLHHLSQKSLEKATLGQTNAADTRVKLFATQQQFDLERLDQSVLAFAKDNRIAITEPAVTMRAEDTGTGNSRSAGKSPTLDRMSPDSPTTPMGTANETRTQTDTIEGNGVPMDDEGSLRSAKSARLERVRNLTGPAFDTEYLSMVIDDAQEQISALERVRVKSDAKLNRLFDQAIKTLRDHQQQAETLSRTLRAS